MGAPSLGRVGRVTVCIVLVFAARMVLADSPNAVLEPDAYRESVTADQLRDLGYNPQEYQLSIPLGRLTIERSYVRVGEVGLLSTGLTEHGTDVIRLSLSPRSTLEFTQDEARAELHGLEFTDSTKRTATLTQTFGGGPTAGTFALTHTDTHASDLSSGFSSSRSDKAGLTWGLGKALALTAGAEDSSALAQMSTRIRRFDVAVGQPGVAIPLAEYHETTTSVGSSTANVTQMALRTPTVKLGDVATASASHSVTESSVTGTETVEAVNVTATPTSTVSVTATHTIADRETSPDATVTTVGSQVKVTPETTVSASFSSTETEGAGTATQRSVGVTTTPADGKGLGVEASYTDLAVTNTEVEPTVHLKLTYATPSQWEFTGLYHDDSNRPDPELGAGLKLPLLGGAVGLNYSEYALDPTLGLVRLNRTYGAEVSRPIAWGLSGRVGYQRTDSLADPTIGERLRIGLGGQSDVVRNLDLQYETGELRTPNGTVPDGSTISLSLARKIALGQLALTGRHTMPSAISGPLPPNDEVHLDLTANW